MGLEGFHPGGLTKKKIQMVNNKCLHGLSISKGGNVPHGWGHRDLVRSPYAG